MGITYKVRHRSRPTARAASEQIDTTSGKVNDEWTVPLCTIHHRQLHDAGDEQRWWGDRQIDPVSTAETLWADKRTLPTPQPEAGVAANETERNDTSQRGPSAIAQKILGA